LKYENVAMQIRAHECIAQNALTNSKRAECFIKGVYPTHIKSAYKCYFRDLDGRRYIDYVCALGTNLFGYGNYKISAAVCDVLSEGAVYSLASDIEVFFAEEIKGKFPFIDKIKILKEGSAGCAAAIKIARAYTKRDYVLSEGYHGWHDAFVQITPPAYGVVRDGRVQEYSDKIDECFLKVCAAVIVEPVLLDASEARQKWLQELRAKCDRHGCLLIFDETITALRFPGYSVAKHWNIIPDIWVGGKALGGGLPISVVGGKREVMDCDYFVSSTWGGDRVAIAAARKALELSTGDYNPDHLWANGQEFLNRFNALDPDIKIEGYPTRGRFPRNLKTILFMQDMVESGVLFGPSWFYNRDLHLEIDNVISLAKSSIKKINSGKVKLKGPAPESPFSNRSRK
jgi:glutamate-1-semialdehyde aminotransferase